MTENNDLERKTESAETDAEGAPSVEDQSDAAVNDNPEANPPVDDRTADSEAVDDEEDVVIYDADAEDAAEEAARLASENLEVSDESEPTAEDEAPMAVRGMAELMAIIEALIFVSDEPLTVKALADVLKEDKGWIQTAVEALSHEFNERNGGLHLREVAGGWQFATRPEHHEFVRAFLKSRPSAKLSLASLETLAVIAYKQPITVPEILEIRGVHSSSAIKTLLDKRLIVAKGRKETVGRPMMYGTSKDFLLQFGLRDLSELPNVEDFEDLASGTG
jgi:segregation and condensation protein B